GTWEQEGEEVILNVFGEEIIGEFDGDELEFEEGEPEGAPRHPGFYPEEIKRITMLGDGRTLDWEMTPEGLVIETPNRKPCKHAYVFKIERYHHPRID
ncbi:MAG: alpha-L-fucosidase C-terminal domain-containing protein, partial [Planctomycetota bacterium]